MKIVVAGNGKVGHAVCEQLAKENHDITLIDNNARVIKDISEELDILGIVGNAASLETQTAANVKNADLFIAATDLDEVNLLCCILAKKIGCKNTIARVRNPEYNTQIDFLQEDLGLSMVVNPEKTAAEEILRILQLPSFIKYDSFANGKGIVVELRISSDSPICDKTLAQIRRELKIDGIICAVERDGNITIPGGSFVIKENDRIGLVFSSDNLLDMLEKMHLSAEKVKNVMLIGAGRICSYLTPRLINNKIKVKIIDKNPDICESFSENFPKATIINADGTVQRVLQSEGLSEMDAVIPLTGIDEENLIISMFADKMNVPKTITKVNRSEYDLMYDKWDIDCTVNPKRLTATEIVRYVRDMDQSRGGSVLTLHTLFNEKVEALEFKIPPQFNRSNIPFSELHFKPGFLCACIIRDHEIIIPTGLDTLNIADSIFVIAPADKKLCELEEMFDVS